MTVTTMKSFAHSTGQSANNKSGGFAGSLLGKAADGLEALEAIGQLARGYVNRFMELAIQAAHVAKQKLEAAKTIPFAMTNQEFNASINPEQAALRRAPSLGLGSSGVGKAKKQKHQEE